MRVFDLIKMYLLSLIIIFVGCSNPSPSQEEIEEIILSLESNALNSWSKGDPIGYSENFADDVTYFDDIGAQTRLDGIEEVKKYFLSLKGKIPSHNYEIKDYKVQVYGVVAILTLQYHTRNNENVQGPPWKATTVYKVSNGEWKVVHANWSLMKK